MYKFGVRRRSSGRRERETEKEKKYNRRPRGDLQQCIGFVGSRGRHDMMQEIEEQRVTENIGEGWLALELTLVRVFTDGSAELQAGWPRIVAAA